MEIRRSGLKWWTGRLLPAYCWITCCSWILLLLTNVNCDTSTVGNASRLKQQIQSNLTTENVLFVFFVTSSCLTCQIAAVVCTPGHHDQQSTLLTTSRGAIRGETSLKLSTRERSGTLLFSQVLSYSLKRTDI